MSADGLCGIFIPGWVEAGKWQSVIFYPNQFTVLES